MSQAFYISSVSRSVTTVHKQTDEKKIIFTQKTRLIYYDYKCVLGINTLRYSDVDFLFLSERLSFIYYWFAKNEETFPVSVQATAKTLYYIVYELF